MMKDIGKSDRDALELRHRLMVDHYERGRAVALDYRPGSSFLGAWGEADRLGINNPERRAWFIEGYLANLSRSMHVDNNGIITRIDGVSKK
jgi:hypothetical protein